MVSTAEPSRFLGVHWRSVWEVIARPWKNASNWAWVRFLTPAVTVTLLDEQGKRQSWLVQTDTCMQLQEPSGLDAISEYVAVALPQDMVLHWNITLPRSLDEEQFRSAMELQVMAGNPFPAQDACWYGCRSNDSMITQSSQDQVSLVLASRSQIEKYLRDRSILLAEFARAPEVWVRRFDGVAGYIVVPGFGEGVRKARYRKGRLLHLGAVAAVFVLVGCIAITPVVKLRAQAIEAVHAYDALYLKARQPIGSREALVSAAERIRQIQAIQDENMNPARVIDDLTRVLPDDTYLTALRMQGRKVTLEGQAANAAQLMQTLGSLPGVQDVVAPVPATRPFGGNKDIFKIEFTLDLKTLAAEPGSKVSALQSVPGRER